MYVAALGEQNRRLTGRFADEWIPHNILFDHLEGEFEVVAAGAKAADRSGDEIEIAPSVPIVIAEDLQYARDRLADHLAYYLGISELYNAVPAQYGFESEAKQIWSEWLHDNRKAASESITNEVIDSTGLTATPGNARETALAMADKYAIDLITIRFSNKL